ncbi:MAG: hypothetical protein ACXWDD_01740 [Aeromicrobium sp.]
MTRSREGLPQNHGHSVGHAKGWEVFENRSELASAGEAARSSLMV